MPRPRRESRIARLMQQSRLPSSKTWDNFKWTRLPLGVARQMDSLRDGSFLDRRENLLVFGKPGSGKSHCLAALGNNWCSGDGRCCSRPAACWCSNC